MDTLHSGTKGYLLFSMVGFYAGIFQGQQKKKQLHVIDALSFYFVYYTCVR